MGHTIYEQFVPVKGGNTYKQYSADFGTMDGKRRRQTFKTVDEAKITIEKNAIIANRIGRQAPKLKDDDLLDAAIALDILQRRVALETAAKFYMQHNHPDGGKKTVSEAIDEFVLSRTDKGCRPVTVKGCIGTNSICSSAICRTGISGSPEKERNTIRQRRYAAYVRHNALGYAPQRGRDGHPDGRHHQDREKPLRESTRRTDRGGTVLEHHTGRQRNYHSVWNESRIRLR